MQVTLEHVTHTYQPGSPFQATAIKNVDLTLHSGEFLALIGHTGSGKSTLAQHINGLLRPTEGRVLMDGRDIHEKGFDKKEVRRRVGLVFQYPEHQLFEESVAKDVAYGLRNLGLSYTMPKDVMKACDATVSITATNLFSLDNIHFADPEQLGAYYPSTRTYWVGIKFNF